MVILLILASYNEVPAPFTSGADETSTDLTSLEDPRHRKY
jgi:hypothetical protein